MARAKPKRELKQAPSALVRALKGVYILIVILAALVVVAYAANKIFIKPPDQSDVPTQAPGSRETDNPVESDDPVGTDEPVESDDPVESEDPEPPVELVRKEGYYTILLACKDQTSGNTDTMMVASYDVRKQKVSIVSIPRDTIVLRKVNGKSYRKINAAYAYGGMKELKAAVSDMLGIPIDYYVFAKVNGFIDLVDAVGGVDFYVPCDMNYDDPDQNLHIHYTKGMYYGLTGQQVMEICRYRDDNYDPEKGYSPSGYANYGIGRDETQRKMIKAIASKLLSWSSFTKIKQYIEVFDKNVETDLSVGNMIWFAEQAYTGFDISTGISMAGLPGNANVTYKGTPYYCQLYPNECVKLLNKMLNPYTTDITRSMTHMVQVQ